jgi:hypothetical protein
MRRAALAQVCIAIEVDHVADVAEHVSRINIEADETEASVNNPMVHRPE